MKTGRRLLAAAAAAAALGACVPYPADRLEEENGGGASGNSQYVLVEGAYPGLDDGASVQDSLHFKVHAYGAQVAQQISSGCEQSFTRTMTDTGLNAFTPRGIYGVVVYGSLDEYRKKTGQPDWSASVAIDNVIYTYFSYKLDGVLAHAMTHLIWLEYMNGRLSDQQRWIDEGLAVYEESQARGPGHELFANLQPTLRTVPMPLDQLQGLAPNTERGYETSLWYAQSESMIQFMLERGGRIGFGQFLGAIQTNQNLDQAVYASFPGKWSSLANFETDWKQNLQ